MRNKPADIPYGGLDADKIRTAHPKFNDENLEYFKQFVRDRYMVHIRKDVEKLPAPWTDNPILREFKFTNVRREHDRTTKHLLKLLEDNKDAKYSVKIMNIIMYRLFNKMETSDLIGWVDFIHYDDDKVKKQLQNIAKDYVYFTNAFYTTGMRQGFHRMYPDEEFEPIRIPRGCRKMAPAVTKAIKQAKTPTDVMNALKMFDGVGDFLAYQMFVDLTYLPEFPWSENEYVRSGPGCEMGLKYLFEDTDGLNYDELMFWLRDNCPITPEECHELLSDLPEWDRHMNVMSLENCMCELSKYIRAATGTGRPKNKYKPRSDE